MDAATPTIIVGSVVGVLAVLLTLVTLYDRLERRFVTRREYEIALKQLSTTLREIKDEMRRLRGDN